MITVGVDLAAEPRTTAVAVIEWSTRAAIIRSVELGVRDPQILEVSRGATSIGIDCPFGWPIEFVEFVAAHSRREIAPRELAGADWRRRLRFRETDRFVHSVAAKWPLSVSTDLLGITAMRCAELLDAFEDSGETVDRAGSGRLVEVYPGVAAKLWGLATAGYKTDPAACAQAATDLGRRAPWLSMSADALALISRSHDAFDAVIASFSARAHALGATFSIPEAMVEAARSEGWIAMPSGPLEDLVRR